MTELKSKYVDITIKMTDINDKIEEINNTIANMYYLIADGRDVEEIIPLTKQLSMKAEQLEKLSSELKCL